MIQDKIFFDEKDPTGLSYNTPFTFYGSYQGRLWSKAPGGEIKYYTQNSDLSVFATTGSNQFNGNQAITGSLTVTGGIIGTTATSSYIEYSNVANKPTLVSGSSQVIYSGLTGIPSGIVSGSAQISNFGIFATTGSNGFNGSQSITGSLTVTGQVVAQTLNVQQVTSSIVYSSGSNIFGNSLANTQQFTGSVGVTGSLTINGTSAVVGSGTTNYVPKFTAGSTIENSTTQTDATGNLMVGSANSGNAGTINVSVGVAGTTAGGLQLWAASNQTHYLQFGDGTTGAQVYAGYLGYAHSTDSLLFGTNGADKMTLTSSGNLGLGVTPSAWNGSWKAFQFGKAGSVSAHVAVNAVRFSSNEYDDVYISTDASTRYEQYEGQHKWYNAPSGTANCAISFTQAMTLNASGNLSIGNACVSALNERLNVTGNGIAIEASDAGSTMLLGNFGSADGILGTYTNDALQIRTNNTARFVISNEGNITVGNFSPSGTPPSDYRSFEIGRQGNTLTGSPFKSAMYVSTNSTITAGSTTFTYRNTGVAGYFGLEGDVFFVSNAISGTAGCTVNFSERMRITSTGAACFACELTAKSLGTNDLILNNLNHDHANYVDGTRGSWLIQEGACDLFIINQVSCKKYKFNLIEIK